jgi:RimJ/RimL family protein N-acetyltransferase
VVGRELETARLRLRPCTTGDRASLHAHWTDPEVRRHLWDDVVIPVETVAEVIAASEASFAARGFGQWVLIERASGALVGCCGLRRIDDGSEIELLYSLAPSRWGQGLVAEAAAVVLRHAFETLGIPRIAGRTDSPNARSARVLERLGMDFEGERPVHGLPALHYALTRQAFLGRR